MFELTTCVALLSNGKDCFGEIAEGAPIPMCLVHLRVAYLFYADYLESVKEITDEIRRDAEKLPIRIFRTSPAALDTVYYVRIGFHIKIGVTSDMPSRMNSLQPDEILATERGGLDVERSRHDQFDHCRARKGREYFDPAPELMAHIADLRERMEEAKRSPAKPIPTAGLVIGAICPNCDLKCLHRKQAFGPIVCLECGYVMPA